MTYDNAKEGHRPYKMFTYQDGDVIASLRVEEIQGLSYAGEYHGDRAVVVQFQSGFAKVSSFKDRDAAARFIRAVAKAVEGEEARHIHNGDLRRKADG